MRASDADRPRDVVLGAVLRELVPALQGYGYELTEQTDTTLHFSSWSDRC
jgi:hypothetical protein